jgi:O-antigen chain-terminating methyltransferase
MTSISLYAFEGCEDHARKLQARFIKYLQNLPGPIVDIGCGRGMFLSQLRANGLSAIGVDSSLESVTACRNRGLEIVQSDALKYLKAHPAQYGGVFASHVIEHLRPDEAQEFFSLAGRSLYPGGRMIVVTPNVADLWMMTEVFWLDISHIRPYPLPLLKALCRSAGIRPILSGTHGIGWRAMGRRRLPQYLWRKIVWGAQYGRSDAWLVGQA